MDTSSPAYSGGSRVSSTDSGSTWAIDTTDDMMFAIWGEDTFAILDAAVFPSVTEAGDRYVAIHYNCAVPPNYPGEPASESFTLTVFEGATNLGKVSICDWGNRATAIYLSPSTATGMTWGSGSVGVVLEEVGGNLTDTYMMQPADWYTEFWELDAWVRTTAQEIEDYYGVDIITDTIPTAEGNVSLPAGEELLTILGSQMFQDCMYGLDELRHELFYMLEYSPEMPDTAFQYTYEESLDWEERIGTQAAADMTTAASVINLDGKSLAGLGMFLGWLVLVGIGVWRTGEPAVATGAAVPFLAGAMWMDLIALAIGAILALLFIIITGWIVFLRST